MPEWNEKPECFGKMSKERVDECRQCEHTHECVPVTMTANLGELAGKSPPSLSSPTEAKPPKIPTPDDMATKCKTQYDALVKTGFMPDQSILMTIHLIASFIYR